MDRQLGKRHCILSPRIKPNTRAGGQLGRAPGLVTAPNGADP
jgi:hypothetical protein